MMRKEISAYIKENKIASIAYLDAENVPHCFHCFYAFDEENGLLFFKSSEETHHAKCLTFNPFLAGSILPAKINFTALKGLQLKGELLLDDFPAGINPSVIYHKQLPLALSKSGKVWTIQLSQIKMTDNSILFNKTIEWQRPERFNSAYP